MMTISWSDRKQKLSKDLLEIDNRQHAIGMTKLVCLVIGGKLSLIYKPLTSMMLVRYLLDLPE